MSGFFRDLLRLIGRYRRGLFLTFLSFLFVWPVLIALSYHFSTRTGFCGNCHFEEPYIESWKASSHAEVACHTCHLPAGFGAKIDRGFKTILATWRYWWGTNKKIPRAEVPDANCLQDGCHETRLIEGPIEFVKGIEFDHAHHVGKEVRGMKLRCTSCHSQIVQGAHMEVTRETCFLCHFKNLPRGEAISGCACHGAPKDVVVHEGFAFTHSQYLTLGVVCEECHVAVTPGTGAVPKVACVTCHNARLEAYDDVPFMHRKHVVDHSVDCAACHEPIGHRDVEMVRSLETSCTGCHKKLHTPQRDLFMGIGAEGVDPYPSVMFKAQVGCEGCHRDTSPGGVEGEVVSTATGEACVLCHGRGFDTMLDEWKDAVADYLGAVEPLLARAKRAYERAGAGKREKVTEGMERAERNMDFVRRGKGEHNLVYTKLILVKIQQDLNEVLAGLDRSWRGKTPLAFSENDLRGNCLASCHANLKRVKLVTFEGLELTHNDHVYKHNLECTYCHDNTETHGKVKLKRENCLGCHHTQENVTCRQCHKTQQKMFAGVGGFGVEKTPAVMVDLRCADCHVDLRGGKNRAATLQACVACHGEGYDEMVGEWRDETRARTKYLSGRFERVRRLRVTAKSRGVTTAVIREAEKLLTEAEAHIDFVQHDRSEGVHNTEFTTALLDKAEEYLKEAEKLLGE